MKKHLPMMWILSVLSPAGIRTKWGDDSASRTTHVTMDPRGIRSVEGYSRMKALLVSGSENCNKAGMAIVEAGLQLNAIIVPTFLLREQLGKRLRSAA